MSRSDIHVTFEIDVNLLFQGPLDKNFHAKGPIGPRAILEPGKSPQART